MTVATDPAVPTIAEVRAAAARLAGVVRRTPVVPFDWLRDRVGAAGIVLKCENLQEMGAFKYRGASNAILALDDATARRGVATHSSGNHGAAVALAAKRRGIPAHVVVPENCSPAKLRNIEEYGARVRLCAPTVAAREEAVADVIRETGATLVHPYDDVLVMAGQGTATLELLEQSPDLETILAPVSGGGLIGGTAIAAHGVRPNLTVLGAEPALADDAARSLRAGRILPNDPTSASTLADGLRATLSPRTFAVLREHVADVLTVSEAQIVEAMRLTWDRAKLVVEPSAAVSIAAILASPGRFEGKRIGVIVSGGNVSLDQLPWKS